MSSCSALKKKPKIEGENVEDIEDVGLDGLSGKSSDNGNVPGLSTVYFGLDSSGLTESVKATLNANAEWIKKNNQTVLLEGHCDQLGSEVYNIGLGNRRARSVARYLKSLGVPDSQIKTISFGEEKPISETDDNLNRRVNFVPE